MTAPTITFGGITPASYPNDLSPTAYVYVTDPDAAQTLTVTFETSATEGFASVLWSGTATIASPQTAGTVSKVISIVGGAYTWVRARVSDGTTTSANTAPVRNSFVYTPPVITGPVINGSACPVVVTTGGPALGVNWSYAQFPVGQQWWRVVLQNAAGSVTYYDSGQWFNEDSGTPTLDAVALGIPTDTSGSALKVTLTLPDPNGIPIVLTGLFDIQWGVVTTTITAPVTGTVLATATPTVSWSGSSTRSKTITKYRLVLLQSGIQVWDSGTVVSGATSVALGVALVDGGSYALRLTLTNSEGMVG